MRAMIRILLISLIISAHVHSEEVFPNINGEELIETVRIEFSPKKILSYRDARREMFSKIDNQNGKVRLVYTGKMFKTQGIPDHTVVNTEHTWPQSRFEDRQGRNWMKSDLHHLYPTFSKVNSSRGNKAYGEINDFQTRTWWGSNQPTYQIPSINIDEYSEAINSVFEPGEAHKGNVASALFYFRTIYGDQNIDYPWFSAQLDTLIGWHVLDPVDEKERRRNESISKIQGNLNPFVIDESLANRVFRDGEVPIERTLQMFARAIPPGVELSSSLAAPELNVLSRFVEENASDPEARSQIRIVSWNAREIFSVRSVNRRKEQLAAFSEDLMPDILLLQEVTAIEQVEKIREYMGLDGYEIACTDFVQDDFKQHRSFEVAIISRFPLTTISEIDPSPDNSPGEPREFPLEHVDVAGITKVATSRGFLRVRIEDVNLIVNVVHLKSANGDYGSDDKKKAQARELVAAAIASRVLADIERYPAYTVMVGGDFNVGETDEMKIGRSLTKDCYKYDCVGEDRYDETHAILGEGLIDGLRMVSKTKDLGMETYNSRNFDGVGPIDCIYVIGKRENHFSEARRAMSTFGSDHFAVWSTFKP